MISVHTDTGADEFVREYQCLLLNTYVMAEKLCVSVDIGSGSSFHKSARFQ